MKKTNFYFVMTLTAMLLITSCSSKDDLLTTQGSLTFTFQNDVNLKSANEFETGHTPDAIFISIKDADGAYVFNLQKIPLVKIGEEYISGQVELDAGIYTVEDFIVTDSENSTLYITPKTGSEFESLINTPLPYEFEITAGHTSSLVLEVIPANLGDPLNFGYSTFSFSIVNTLERGLMAYYPLSGNAVDSSGNGNDGIVNGATLTADRNGQANAAYYFDGNDDIAIPTASFFDNMSTFSICAWVNPVDMTSGTVISKVTPNRDFVLETSAGDTDKFGAHFAHGATYYKGYSENDVLPGTWTYLICQWTGTNWKFYINGMFAGESENTGAEPLWTGTIMAIGSMQSNIYFRGKIDDIRIYNRVLTEREINELYGLN